MVGIGVDHISITRRLPIDGADLGRVLAQVRADSGTATLVWRLGERGNCELDLAFVASGERTFRSTARLAGPDGKPPATVDVALVGCTGAESELELRPAAAIGGWWHEHLGAYLDLAHAALEEFAQELLWHASRLDSAA